MGSSLGPVATARSADVPHRAVDRSFDPGLSFDVHGVGLRVRSDMPEALAVIEATYEAFRVDDPLADVADFALTDLRSGGPCLLQAPTGEARRLADPTGGTIALLEALVGTVVEGLHRQGLLAVHAGAAAGPSGVILIAGRSGQGKSTLILGLVRRGLELMSDELALLDPAAGLVHPYPRAIHVRPATIGLIPELTPSRLAPATSSVEAANGRSRRPRSQRCSAVGWVSRRRWRPWSCSRARPIPRLRPGSVTSSRPSPRSSS